MSKLIYVVIAGASAGIAHSIREAAEELGIKTSDKSPTPVEIHSIPSFVVRSVDTPEVKDDGGKVIGRDVVVNYRTPFTTLAAQQLKKYLHRKEVAKIKLLKASTQIIIDTDEEDDTDE